MAGLNMSRGWARLAVMDPMLQVVMPYQSVFAVEVQGQEGLHWHSGQALEPSENLHTASKGCTYKGQDLCRDRGFVPDQQLEFLD